MSKSRLAKRINIATLYTLYCFDIAAIVIVFIIFTPFLIKTSSLFVPETMSLGNRNALLGLLFASYPITQFLGAPILGDLSDHFGRRIILNISTIATALTFCLTALSILSHHLPLLFLSRIMGGFFAGNASLAQAAVSDMAPPKKKSSYMALFRVVGGLSWIIGPFLGAFLSNPAIVSWFKPSVPFWFLGLIFLLIWLSFLLTMECDRPSTKAHNLSIAQTFKNLLSIFHVKIIVLPFIASGISMFGWMILQSFTAPYLMEKYHFHEHQVGYVYAYYSVFWLLGGLFALSWFKRHTSVKLNSICLLITPFFLITYALIPSPDTVWWASPIPSFLMSISMAAFTAIFAHLVEKRMQGKIFGAYTGIIALSTAFAPAISGWLSKYSLDLPFLLAAFIIFTAFILYTYWYVKNKKSIIERGA